MAFDIENINNSAWDAMFEMVQSGNVDTVQLLHVAASQYLLEVQDVEKDLISFTDLLKLRSKYSKIAKNGGVLNNNEIFQLTNTKLMISDFLQGDIPHKLYNAAFSFQKILNQVLGQTIKMVYVFPGASGPELYEITNEDILKFDTSSRHQITGRYNAAVEDLNKSLKKLELTESIIYYDPKNLVSTYNETIRRYNISRAHKNHVVLCKPNGIWWVNKVSTIGDINEAYAAVVILNQPNPNFKNDLEQNIYDFLIYYVNNANNISGLLQGDISVDNIEYAIKSANASTLGLAQLKKLAQQIMADPGYDLAKLREKKQSLANSGKLRNKIRQFTGEIEQDLLKDFINLTN